MKQLLLVSMLFAALLSAARENNTPNAQQFANKRAPLSFMENKGQITDQHYQPRPDIQFQLKAANGLTIFVGDGALHYQFAKADKMPEPIKPEDRFDPKKMMEQDSTTYTMYRMDVELIGANKQAKIITEDKQDYYENYYTTGTGEKGATVYAYSKITYQDIYPHIDWVLYTKNNELKHEFVVKKGGNPADIQLKYGGATNLVLNIDGSLTATTPQGTITEQAPIAYTREGQEVKSQFVLQDNVLSYEVGNYDGELVIDPSLVWATYYGGPMAQFTLGIAKDGAGNIYITGVTGSSSGIATSGAYQTSMAGGGDAFIAKFNSSCSLIWATYYGGTGSETPWCIATDVSGNICIGGYTNSANGIATSGAYQTSFSGGNNGGDAFIAKFSSTGLRIWATYYGGTDDDLSFGIATDINGNIYITGKTRSSSGIATTGAYQTSMVGTLDGFLAKFSSTGSRIWSTYYAGNGNEEADGIATDNIGNVYITGLTGSTSGIATSGAFQTTMAGGGDAFIAKFNSSGSIIWATYFGGNDYDKANCITLDGSGNIYITGETMSITGLATVGANQSSNAGGYNDAFIAKFSSAGYLIWATYYGGTAGDVSKGITTDISGNIYITGYTASTTGIATIGAYQTTMGYQEDAFLARFSALGTLYWATYFGGDYNEESNGVTVDVYGNVYFSGRTESSYGIATPGAYQTTYSTQGPGYPDAFIAKFNFGISANAGYDSTICLGKSTHIGATSQLNHLYSWTSNPSGFSSSLSNPVVTPIVSTIYYLKDSLSGSGSGYDTVIVTVNPLPTINAGNDVVVCAGNNIILNATSNASNIVWNNGVVNNQSFAPTISGNYIVTATSSQGCVKKDTAVVTIHPLPNVNAGLDQNVCTGNATTLSASGAVNYSWSGGITNNQSFIPASSGSYVVTGTDANGCSKKDTVVVVVNPLPTATILSTNTVICPLGNTQLTANGGISYLWSNGDTATTTTINQAGSYYVVAANQYGCTDTSNIITITQKAIPAVIKTKYTSSSIVCQPNMVAYALDMPVGSVTGFSYQWYLAGSPIAGATDSVFNAAITGSYAVAVSGGSNCHNFSLYKPATVKSTPVANCASLSTSTTICAGSFVILAAPFITNATYTWLKDGVAAGAGSTKSFKAAGNYSVVVKLNGCSDTSNPTIPVVVNPLPVAGIVAASPTTFCAGDSCLLTAQPMGMVVYDWYNSTNLLDTTTTPNYKIGINATMKVLVTDANGCTSKLSSASIKTKVTPVPLVSITTTGSTTISSTGSVKLKATQIGGATYQWYKDGNIINGAILNYFTAYSGGSYTVAVTKTGCTGYSQAVVVTQTTPKQEGTTINEGSFELSAYPNPVSDVLTVTLSGIEDVNGTLEMIDVLGKAVQCHISMVNNSTFNIQTSTLSSGVYFIRYKDDEGRTGMVKVVKE